MTKLEPTPQLRHATTSRMSALNSIINFYQGVSPTVLDSSPAVSPTVIDSSDVLYTDFETSPVQPLHVFPHDRHRRRQIEQREEVSPNVASGCTEMELLQEMICPAIENLPTGLSDMSARHDTSSYRLFLLSPRKWFNKLSASLFHSGKNIEVIEGIEVESSSAVLRDNGPMEIITLESVSVFEDDPFTLDDAELAQLHEEQNAEERGVDIPQDMCESYLQYLTLTGEINNFNNDLDDYADDEDFASRRRFVQPMNPVLSCENLEDQTLMYRIPLQDVDPAQDEERLDSTIRRRGTLRRLTNKIFGKASHSAPPPALILASSVDEEEKENFEPVSVRRSQSLREKLSSISLRRSVSKRWKSKDEAAAVSNLVELFDSPAFHDRLQDGHVSSRRPLEDGATNAEENQDVEKTGGRGVIVLGERKPNQLNNGQRETDKLGHGGSTFHLFREKTLRRALSIRDAAYAAAKEFRSTYNQEN